MMYFLLFCHCFALCVCPELRKNIANIAVIYKKLLSLLSKSVSHSASFFLT